MKRLTTLCLIALGACATSQDVWGGRIAARETQAVQIAAVRYIAEHYEPSEYLGQPEAICLVVGQQAGRRDRIATALAARSEDMDPPASLLSRLRQVRPRVLPISACRWGEDLSEVLVDSGARAIALGISHPQWVTPNLARVTATLRENQRIWYRYRCSAERGPDGWTIRRCL
ncbi:MAG: hypothetical protein IIB36_14400 [Gemmatimonadetes bacterium]|nr:hypothetical protein [Gemmatimonadota bacterium]